MRKNKSDRHYQPRLGVRRQRFEMWLDPDLIRRLKLIAESQGTTVAGLLALAGEKLATEAKGK